MRLIGLIGLIGLMRLMGLMGHYNNNFKKLICWEN